MTGSRVPARLTTVGHGPHALLSRGFPLGPLVLLRTYGRVTGVPHTTPVAPLTHAGTRYLVSPFGDTAWVRNARADPRAAVGRGRRWRPIRLTELTGPDRPVVLRHYRRHYRIVPFVRHAFTARPRDGIEAFAAEAHDHPVFAAWSGRPGPDHLG